MLKRNGWEAHYVSGQLAGIDVLAASTLPGIRGKVYVTPAENRLSEFILVELREWHRLGQFHGLTVEPNLKQQGIATALVRRAESFISEESGRGVYVDTPATDEIARRFYQHLGYRHAYTMPEYYDEGLDGVTYLKLLPKEGL
jgi:ribosomal protein S18 acetylase RimI-like enzyme